MTDQESHRDESLPEVPVESNSPEESVNPYSTPVTEGGGPAVARNYRPLVRLYLLPFLLAHLVYWPSFFICLQITNGRDYGVGAMLYATGLLAVGGMIYGTMMGLRLRRGAYGDESAFHALHPALYALGQGVWFVFCVFAPCAVLLGAA